MKRAILVSSLGLLILSACCRSNKGVKVELRFSTAELVRDLSQDPKEPAFRKALKKAKREGAKGEAFFDAFLKAFRKNASEKDLVQVVRSRENQNLFPPKASDEQVIETMKKKRVQAIKATEKILKERIEGSKACSPTIERSVEEGRFSLKIPGVEKVQWVRRVLCPKAFLGFYKTYGNRRIGPAFQKAERALRKKFYPEFEPGDTIRGGSKKGAASSKGTAKAEKRNPLFSVLRPNVTRNRQDSSIRWSKGPIVGFAKISDTSRVNELLHHPAARKHFPENLHFMWSAERIQGDVLRLYAIEEASDQEGAVITGKHVTDASYEEGQKGLVRVNMQMDERGTLKWAHLTGHLAKNSKQGDGRAVAIVLDEEVYSAPVVNEKITNGRSGITMGGGNKAENLEEAKGLVRMLDGGSYPVPLGFIEGKQIQL